MWKRLLRVVMLHILAVVFVLTALLIGIKCPVYEITHLYCPGCGATRMLKALLDFDVVQAFRYNPFIFITTPMIVTVAYRYMYLYIVGKDVPERLDNLILCYAVCLVLFGVIRNVNIFSVLQPTSIH